MKRDNARLYAKRFTTTSSIIGKNSAIFCSDSLFSRHSNPQKIYVFFIEGDNFVGRRTKFFYKFSRKWPAASAWTTVRTDGRREGANEPTSTAFIKGIRMTINGSSIDSLTTKGSEHDDEIAFARLQIFNTFLALPFTSGISYEDFMNGCYVWCADISTSLESNFDYLIPTVLDGMTRLEVEFSAPLGVELVMLTIGQHPSLIEIGRDRSISVSYPV
ncbi:uncharacterized protein LOC131891935 isoform X3 [Tigriopus californicus]|uniref:uncharacterized protein LOC131891935 isoform X3 n=1 Tax=Tigriopus californicus TaxID=6832 RepID=UPI0027D9D601|nr:uncharacterized protein LOC131891935 isoform X3 [Tigriopus californicus]